MKLITFVFLFVFFCSCKEDDSVKNVVIIKYNIDSVGVQLQKMMTDNSAAFVVQDMNDTVIVTKHRIYHKRNPDPMSFLITENIDTYFIKSIPFELSKPDMHFDSLGAGDTSYYDSILHLKHKQ